MADLRRPHERRSDQLSVLVRRPLSAAALVPRFLRTADTFVASPRTFRFDDYDSDTETDATNSDAHHRLRRSSSASAISVPSFSRVSREPPPSCKRPSLTTPAHSDSRPPVVVMASDDMLMTTHFARSRARSFYGKAADVDDDHSSSGGSDHDATGKVLGPTPVSEHSLRGALGEDYDLFARPRPSASSAATGAAGAASASAATVTATAATATAAAAASRSRERSRSPSPVSTVSTDNPRLDTDDAAAAAATVDDDDDDDTSLSRRRRGTYKRAATSPSLRRRNTAGVLEPMESAHSDTRAAGIVRRLVSATSARAAKGQAPLRRQARRSRSYADPAESRADFELTARAEELRRLIVNSRAADGITAGPALFVEEAGRNPRVAFVDGDLRRVKVRHDDGARSRCDTRASSLKFGRRYRRRTRRRSSTVGNNPSPHSRRRGFAFGLVRRLQEVDQKLHDERARKRRARRAKRKIGSSSFANVHIPAPAAFDHDVASRIDSHHSSKRERHSLFTIWAR